jgi:hypothetical protein
VTQFRLFRRASPDPEPASPEVDMSDSADSIRYQLATLAPATGMRILRLAATNERPERWVWVCQCCPRRSAPWPVRPTMESAWVEHDKFTPVEPLPVEGAVFL